MTLGPRGIERKKVHWYIKRLFRDEWIEEQIETVLDSSIQGEVW